MTGENTRSHDFHKLMCFFKACTEKHSGYKFGRWLDVLYWQYALRTGDEMPEPVRYHLPDAEIAEVLAKVNP